MHRLLVAAAAAVLVAPGIAGGARASRTRMKPYHVAVRVTAASGGETPIYAYATREGMLRLMGGMIVPGELPAAPRGATGVVPRFGGRATTPVEFQVDMDQGEVVFDAVDRSAKLRVDVVPGLDSRLRRTAGEGPHLVVRRRGDSLSVRAR